MKPCTCWTEVRICRYPKTFRHTNPECPAHGKDHR